MSTRTGSWVIGRLADGVPFDTTRLRRFTWWIISRVLPRKLVNAIIESKANKSANHDLLGIRPKHGYRYYVIITLD